MNIQSLPTSTERRKNSLRNSVEICLKLYLDKLDGDEPSDVYRMVIGETEFAILKTVLEYTDGNQSKAAECLGITRGTLRKKLRQHNLNGRGNDQ
jgi:Fis family transcriptional regulator